MENSNSNEGSAYKSGNIFGWKFSFISLGIILVTLIAVILTENYKQYQVGSDRKFRLDSVEVERVDSLQLEDKKSEK